jgi:hypothetical protein
MDEEVALSMLLEESLLGGAHSDGVTGHSTGQAAALPAFQSLLHGSFRFSMSDNLALAGYQQAAVEQSGSSLASFGSFTFTTSVAGSASAGGLPALPAPGATNTAPSSAAGRYGTFGTAGTSRYPYPGPAYAAVNGTAAAGAFGITTAAAAFPTASSTSAAPAPGVPRYPVSQSDFPSSTGLFMNMQ